MKKLDVEHINMEQTLELTQERAGLLREAHKLLDLAMDEKRDLKPSEESRFNECLGGANFLAKRINSSKGTHDRGYSFGFSETIWSPEECRKEVAGFDEPMEPNVGRQVSGPISDNPFPGEVRVLRHDEKLAARGGRGGLSLGRLVKGIVTGNWRGATEEQRTLSAADSTLGGYLVPTPLSSFIIDLARNQSRIFQAGALTVPMESSTLKLARVTGDPSASWRAENTPIPASDMTFGSLELRVRTLGTLVKVSVELIEDAINMPELIENALSQAIALELDRAVLRGKGTLEPIGIRNWTNIQKIDLGVNGGTLTGYSKFSEAVQKIAERNGADTGLAAIYAPRTSGAIDRFSDTTGQPLVPPASFTSLRRLVTNQVPTDLARGTAGDASEAYIGDFSQCLVGMRTQLTLEISRQAADTGGSAFRDLQVWIRCYLRADMVLARPEHFVLIDGIIP
ncbi:MAG: phage major capsid protein [Firmicutes bacterium]|nr:phage major capsid protein [Bacillota bacterium]MBU4553731.1 phage major capsid protein [Bacillota bacterium]MBV1728464.1 phage major capsid protein [Desulforudis sp.]MBV1735753.1 phage major capsid protein [Desulforudis sp.]MBV1770099.1 phage major capsid protein [Desulforudis sp.]